MRSIHNDIEGIKQKRSKGVDKMTKMRTGKRIIAFTLASMMLMQSTVTAGATGIQSFSGNFDEPYRQDEMLGSGNDGSDTQPNQNQDNTNETEDTTIPQDQGVEEPQELQEQQEPQEPAEAVITSTAVQDVQVQEKEDGTKDTYIRYEVSVKNESQEVAADHVNVKMILPETLSYEYNETETEGLSTFENAASLSEGFDLNEVDEATLAAYGNGQVLMWAGQSLAAGEEKSYVCYALAQKDVVDTAALTAVIYGHGQYVEATWTNGELLAENVTPEPTEIPEVTDPTDIPEETEPTEPTDIPEETEPTEPTKTPEKNITEEGNAFDKLLKNSRLSRSRVTTFGLTRNSGAPAQIPADTFFPAADGIKFSSDLSEQYGWISIEMNLQETEGDAGKQFAPYYKEGSLTEANTAPSILYYDLSKVMAAGESGWTQNNPLIITENITDQPIYDRNDKTKVWGYFSINTNGMLTMKLIDTVTTVEDCSIKLNFNARYNLEQAGSEEIVKITFPGIIEKDVTIQGGYRLVAEKKVDTAFDVEKQGFRYQLDLEAKNNVTQKVTITDTMGTYLEYLHDSLEVVKVENGQETPVNESKYTFELGQNNKSFTLEFPRGLKNGNYKVVYYGKIVDKYRDELNGQFSSSGMTNRAVFKIDDKDSKEITKETTVFYTHEWIKKTNAGLGDDETIQWTLTVNDKPDFDASGYEVTDALMTEKLVYDMSRPVVMQQYDRDGTPVGDPVELKWMDILSDDAQSWAYEIPNSGGKKYKYTFQFYTRALAPDGITDTYVNVAKVGDKATDDSTVRVNASDFGTSKIDKVFNEVFSVTEGESSQRYAKWTTTLRIPAGSENVVYTDRLVGDHIFPEDLTVVNTETPGVYNQIYVQGKKGRLTASDEKSFTINFSDEEFTENTTIIIQYYSRLGADATGSISNIGEVKTDNFVQTDVDGENLSEFFVDKQDGVYDEENQIITWTVNLGSGFGDGQVTIKDRFENQTYIEGSAKIYKDGSLRPLSWDVTPAIDGEGYLVGKISLNDSNAQYVLQYETKPVFNEKGEPGDCGNKIWIYRSNSDELLVEDEAKAEVPNNIFDKSIITAPDDGNSYTASFRMLINEGGINLESDTENEYYEITDRFSTNMEVDWGTFKVYHYENHTKGEEVSPENIQDDGDPTLVIPSNPGEKPYYEYVFRIYDVRGENNKGKSYWVEYDAVVNKNKGDTIETEYFNHASVLINQEKYYSDVDQKVDILSDASGEASGSVKYFNVLKRQKNAPTSRLKGAIFALYKNEGTDEEPSYKLMATKESDENGSLYFGNNPDINGGTKPGDFPINYGDQFKLVEIQAPEGYQRDETEYIFTFDRPANEDRSKNVFTIGHDFLIDNTPFEITAKKEWKTDEGLNTDRDGKQPESIWVQLYRNNEPFGDSVELKSSNRWTASWKNLLSGVYDSTTEEIIKYTYSVEEGTKDADGNFVPGEPAGYTGKITNINGNAYAFLITNSYNIERVNINLEKNWNDAENADGNRPEKIQVQLYKTVNGKTTPVNSYKNEAGKTVNGKQEIKAGENGQWSYSWEGLPKNEKVNGTTYEVIYSAKEVGQITDYVVGNDDVTTDGTVVAVDNKITLINDYDREETEYSVEKKWNDSDNQDGDRPESIQVRLRYKLTGETDFKDYPTSATKTLSADSKYKASWSELPVRLNGKQVIYQAYELNKDGNLVEGTTATLSGPKGSVNYNVNYSHESKKTTITNGKSGALTEFTVTKSWKDDSNAAQKRPTRITVFLESSTMVLDEKTDTYDYQKDSDGNIVYTKVNGSDRFLGSGNMATYTWKNLPKFSRGKLILYRADEVPVPGYDTEKTPSGDAGTLITNTYVETEISVQKIWDDDSNRDGKRWESVELVLYADGKQATKELIGQEPKVTLQKANFSGNTWSYTWKKLPKFSDATYNTPIVYTVVETIPQETNGYKNPVYAGDAANGFTITNSYITAETSVEAEKIWKDEIRPEGARPDSITLELWASEQTRAGVAQAAVKVQGKDIVLDGTADNNGEDTPWHATWSNLPKYANGHIIKYSVKEQNSRALQEGKYTGTVTKAEGTDANGYILARNLWSFVVTNTREDEKVSIQAKKKWADNNNSDGRRPVAIEVTLYQSVDGENPTVVAGKAPVWITGSATAAEWAPNTAKWENLPKYTADQRLITYSVKETAYRMSADDTPIQLTDAAKMIQGYEEPTYSPESSSNSAVITITNTRDYEKTKLRVRKEWNDEDNYDGHRASSVSVQLYQTYQDSKGEDVKSEVGSLVTLNVANSWTYKWSLLPKNIYVAGESKELTYSVEEETVWAEYSTPSYTTEAIDGYDVAFVVTNTHELEKIRVQLRKNWQDNGNQDVKRPEELLVKLYRYTGDNAANAEAVAPYKDAQGNTVATEVALKGDMTATIWEHTWSNLPKRAQGGAIYTYMVKEGVKDSEGNFLPYNNTDNKLEHYTVSDSVTTKVGTGQNQIIPGTDELKADDQRVAIINTHKTDRMQVELIKNWIEDDASDRPAEVTFTLMASRYDGQKWSEPAVVTADQSESANFVNPVKLEVKNSKMTYQWSGLEVNSNGEPIRYSVEESHEGTYQLTQEYGNGLIEAWNTKVEKKRIDVSKEWDDFENASGKRPSKITIILWADEKVEDIQTIQADAQGQWSYSWEDLPVYTKGDNGQPVEIDYEVTEGLEARLKGYEEPVITDVTPENSQNESWKIVNRYHELVEKTVTKTWDDNSNQDGIRPEIYVGLYGDDIPVTDIAGNPYVEKVTGNIDQWTHTWNDLPKYNAANDEIVYSVKELKSIAAGTYVPYTTEELEALGYTQITNSDDPMTLINKHTPDETEISVTKEWVDGNNIGGYREEITVNLLADGNTVDTKKLNAGNNWTASWTKLPLKKAGQIIDYTVQEIMSASLKEHYDSQVIRVTYPIDLVKSTNLTEQAEKIAGAEGEPNNDNVWEFKISNTYKEEFVAKTVNKIWIDNDNQDKLRNDNTVIKVQLYQTIDGGKVKYDDPSTPNTDEGLAELSASNNWSYTWNNLPKYEEGKEGVEIKYSIEEVTKLTGYEASVTETAGGFELTNYHDTDKTSYGVVKYWIDNNNENRPRTVKFQLYAEKYNEGTGQWDAKVPVGEPAEFSGQGDRWEYLWTNLEKNYGGQEIKYSVEEIDVDQNYTVSYQVGEFVTYATNTSTTTEFSKTDITGSLELEGAVLQVTSEDGQTVVEQWTSGKTPHVIKGKLKAGNTYLLKEVSSPAGYGIAEPVKFTVNTDGKIQKVVMIDEYTNISILKTDDEGKPLAGAKLAIMDREKNGIIEEWVSTDKAHVIEGKLVVGETYILTELEVPLGYYKAADMAFTVPENGKVELTMVDKAEEAVGKITATKRVSLLTDDFEFIPHIMAKDVTFYMALFKDAEGKERYTEYDIKSVEVKKDMSVSDPVVWENMPSGTYYVFETDSKGNAVPLATEITETDDKGNEYTYSCVLAEGTESNMVQLAMQQEMLEGVVNLENAYHELPDGYYNTGEITINKRVLRNGETYTTNNVFHAGIFTRDEDNNYELLEPVVTLVNNGSVTVEVPLGGENFTEPITYYVMETDDAGIPIDKDVFAYEVSGEGSVLLNMEDNEGSVTITNELKDNTVEMDILKVDEAGKGLAGAAFQLTYREGNMTAGRWDSTTETRTITLIPGTYTLSELNAPAGYVKGADATITVSENGEIKVSGADISYTNGVAKYVNRKSTTTTPTPTPTSTFTRTSTGGGSSITTSSTSKASNAKTGDETPIALYVLVLFGALAAAGYVVSRKRKSR